ncbi:hypothetical protein NIES593_19135 [Hydrococcus rivularis NIES-593]|uniref:Uncharacterized protein n=1 Tax=Hydrococcus rivularis NIES-593 TaxID=1921803 RepID=A0A1U7H9X4_9CYAN|nr:hypothetical protein NIES593_19135 [Hydrococcus rivularis NIES-593]
MCYFIRKFRVSQPNPLRDRAQSCLKDRAGTGEPNLGRTLEGQGGHLSVLARQLTSSALRGD